MLTVALEFGPKSPLATQMGRWRWLENETASRAALALLTALNRGDDVEVLAHDLAHSVLAIDDSVADCPAWFVELKAILDRDFAEPLRFDQLAHQAGMHPVYVSRAFRRYAGTSMREYVSARRLAASRHELATTRRTAAAIALDAGFADASHLSRTFSRALGLTPRAFRKCAGVDSVQVLRDGRT